MKSLVRKLVNKIETNKKPCFGEHKRIQEPMEGQHHLSLAEDPVTLCKFSPVVRNISKAIFD